MVKEKYEFRLISGNRTMINRESKLLQDDGWELAGNITTYTGKFNYEGMLVPFKRRIKKRYSLKEIIKAKYEVFMNLFNFMR